LDAESRRGGLAGRIRVAKVLFALAMGRAVTKGGLPSELTHPPGWMVVPFADWINAVFNFIGDDLGLIHVTRAFAEGWSGF
jgi:glycine betaine/proline transport system permease protein